MLSVLALVTNAQVVAQVNAQGVVAAFSARSSVVLGEPVLIGLTIQNRLDERIDFDLGDDLKGNLRIAITDPKGVTTNASRYVASGVHRSGKISLSSRGTQQQYVLNEWAPLRVVGRYRVSIDFVDIALRTRSGTTLVQPPAEVLVITIQPRNSARLREVCERHAERAISSEMAQHRLDAGRVLAQFDDPAVIPCFERITRVTTHLDSFIIPALGKIGTAQAEAVLRALFKSNQSDRYKLANNELRRFQLRSKPEVD